MQDLLAKQKNIGKNLATDSEESKNEDSMSKIIDNQP